MTKRVQAKLLQGLRELLGGLDLELQFDDAERNNPKEFISELAGDGGYYIRFKPYGWQPKRAPAIRSH